MVPFPQVAISEIDDSVLITIPIPIPIPIPTPITTPIPIPIKIPIPIPIPFSMHGMAGLRTVPCPQAILFIN